MVNVSTISPREIILKVGNQEFPEIMNKTPGVYTLLNKVVVMVIQESL